MPSSVELICIDPARITEMWPHASGLIKSAIERTGLSDFADIERDVLNGHQLLWLAWSDHIEAAATTKLVQIGRHKVCILVACSGQHRERWLSLLGKIEAYAKAEHCRIMRVYGRKGWMSVLKDYRVEHVVLDKELN